LKPLFEEDDRRKVKAGQADRISRILAVLNRANGPEVMALPGYRLHSLKGGLSGFWAVPYPATGGSSSASAAKELPSPAHRREGRGP